MGDGKFLSNFHEDGVVLRASELPGSRFLWPSDGELIAFPTGLHAWNATRYLLLAVCVPDPVRRIVLVTHARSFWKCPETADELHWRSPAWGRWNGNHKALSLHKKELAILETPQGRRVLRKWQRRVCVYKYKHNIEVRRYLDRLQPHQRLYHHGGKRVRSQSYWWGKINRVDNTIIGHDAVGDIWNRLRTVHQYLKENPQIWKQISKEDFT